MKTLRDKIKFTKEQEDAMANMIATVSACRDLGIDFVFDHEINALVAINLSEATYDYTQNEDDYDESIDFNYPPFDDYDDCKWEVVNDIRYTNTETGDGIIWVNENEE